MKNLIVFATMLVAAQAHAGFDSNSFKTYKCQTGDQIHELSIVEKFNRVGKYINVTWINHETQTTVSAIGYPSPLGEDLDPIKGSITPSFFSKSSSEQFNLSNGMSLILLQWTKPVCPRCSEFAEVINYGADLQVHAKKTLEFSCLLPVKPSQTDAN